MSENISAPDYQQAGATDVRGDVDDGEEDQEAFLNSLTQQEVDELKNMVNSDNIYQRLVSSIAPTVYGKANTPTTCFGYLSYL